MWMWRMLITCFLSRPTWGLRSACSLASQIILIKVVIKFLDFPPLLTWHSSWGTLHKSRPPRTPPCHLLRQRHPRQQPPPRRVLDPKPSRRHRARSQRRGTVGLLGILISRVPFSLLYFTFGLVVWDDWFLMGTISNIIFMPLSNNCGCESTTISLVYPKW